IEVLQKIRGDDSLVPVIVLTARQDAEEKIRQLKLSISCYITKPFSFDQLAECVRNGIINGDAALPG
ncbi:MAG: response regulator, partial [Actinobacteria bacterium]|nr:response regulator [Actinomycetota bacterium]